MVSRDKLNFQMPNRSASSMNFNSGLPKINPGLNGSRSNFALARNGKIPGMF